MAKNDTEKKVKRAKALIAKLDSVKSLYGELDALAVELKGESELLAKHGLVAVNNFAEKNTVFRPHGIRQWELKLQKVEG